MLAHVSIQCSDPAASRAFYEAVLAALGGKALLTYGEHVGFRQEEAGPDFWIGPVNTPGGPHDDVHIAFAAPTRAQVDAFVDAARAHGAEVLHPPQEWWYRPGYYGGFVRDPDGNNVDAVNLVERITPAARWIGVAVDCADAGPVARFYERVLGFEVRDLEPPHGARLPNPSGGVGLSIQGEPWYEPPTWPERPGEQSKMLHLEVDLSSVGVVDWYAFNRARHPFSGG